MFEVRIFRDLSLILAAVMALALCDKGVQARPNHGGISMAVNANCPQGLTYSAYDGCLGAQSSGSSGVDSSLLTSFNAGTPYNTPPPFNVPARDYPVGYETGTPLTPVASWTPPSNTSCSKNSTTHIVTCNTNSATCANNCVIDHVDFTDWRVIMSGDGVNGHKWIVTNNLLKNGPTVAVANAQQFTIPTGVRIDLDFMYNEVDGSAGTVGFDKGLQNVNGGSDGSNLLTYNILYNWFHDIPGNPMSINSTYANININWNFYNSFDQDQWAANDVDIDATNNTLTINGPFITTGTNLVHTGQGGCVKYSSVPVNASSTAVAGTIGNLVSGTVGSFPVTYAFTGAAGDQTGIILECGRGLHGEINLSGIDDGTVQNSMVTRGNLMVYGDDCPANGTANNALIVSPGRYTSVTDAHIDYNTMINRNAGTGRGCAAHALNNNGFIYFNSVDISHNYVDPTNTSGFQGNSTTSCFFWPGGVSFVGTQSGTTLTVTSTSPGGKLPVGQQVTQSSVNYGYVIDNSAANADGTGNYTMSDSRSLTFSSGGSVGAPNQANAAGSVPYAPFFTGNKNMLLSGTSADFAISDQRMTTSAACHT